MTLRLMFCLVALVGAAASADDPELTLYDGAQHVAGQTWADPPDHVTFIQKPGATGAAELVMDATWRDGWAGAGFNWCSWYWPGTDTTRYDVARITLRVPSGDVRDVAVWVFDAKKRRSQSVELIGAHLVEQLGPDAVTAIVPLSAFTGDFDRTVVWEIAFQPLPGPTGGSCRVVVERIALAWNFSLRVPGVRFPSPNNREDTAVAFAGDALTLHAAVARSDGPAPTTLAIEAIDGGLPEGMTAEPILSERLPIDRLPFAADVRLDVRGRAGAWTVRGRLLDAAGRSVGRETGLDVVVLKPLPKPADPAACYFGAVGSGDASTAEFLQRGLGIWNARDAFNWAMLEPERKGQMTAASVATQLASMDRGFVPMFTCSYTPHWAMRPDRPNRAHPEWGDFSFGPPRDANDYADFLRRCDALVKPRRAQGQQYTWAFWNEPDEIFWDGSVEEFVSLLEVQYRTLKALDPSYQVVGFDPTGVGFVKQVCDHGGAKFCDIFGIHAYMQNTPEQAGLEAKMQALTRLRDEFGPGKPIWMTEGNFKGHGDPAAPDAAQGFQTVRGYVLMMKEGIQRFYWYGLGNGRSEDMSPPTFAAYNQMVRMLDLAQYREEVPLADRLTGYARCYLFERDGEIHAVVWRQGKPTTLAFTAPAGCRAEDLYGNALPVKPGTTELTISCRPFYLACPTSALPALRDALRAATIAPLQDEFALKPAAKVELQPLHARLADKPQLVFRVKILGGEARGGRLRLTTLPDGWTAEPSEVAYAVTDQVEGEYHLVDIPFTLTAAPRNERNNALFEDKTFSVGWQLATDHGDHRDGQARLSWEVITTAKRAPTIDGDLSDWTDALPAVLADDVHEREVRWAVPEQLAWKGPDDCSATAMFMVDATCFYAGIAVRDDHHVQTGKGWAEDSVQLGIGADFKPELWLEGDAPRFAHLPPSARLAAKRVGTTTTYELAIPLADYPYVRPKPGATLGLNVLINDEDGDGRGRHVLEYAEGISTTKDTQKYPLWSYLP